jgi:site-specific recombinase XerD
MDRRDQTHLLERDIDPLIRLLVQLPPDSLNTLVSLARQISEGNGRRPEHMEGFRISTPAEGIPFWVAKMKSERYSEGTIRMYHYLAERYLKGDPTPTRLGLQSYLAGRLEGGTSPAMAENERKALSSLFRFLVEEGLWPENPTAGIKHIKVGYGQKEPPSIEDVERVLGVGCARSQDSDKIRTIIVLLATTGLRLTEGLSLRKDAIDFGARELRIVGKGGKPRVVPLLEGTAEMLTAYIETRPSDSPFVFPGRTRTGYAEIYNIEKTLKRACLRAGVRPFTPHGLRHLYATHALKNGAKLEVVSRILGHASVGITGDVYRFVKSEEMHLEAERFAPLNGAKMLPDG